jgi:hypothetical protein
MAFMDDTTAPQTETTTDPTMTPLAGHRWF